jgi:hypothetical protein
MHVTRLPIIPLPLALFATTMVACQGEPIGSLDPEIATDDLSFAAGSVPIIGPIDRDRGSEPAPAPDQRRAPRGLIATADARGSGCTPGTASLDIARDGRTVEVTYDRQTFRAETGSITEARKNCVAVLSLNVPRGTTFAVTAVEHSGTARLRGGAVAAVRTSYHFVGGEEAGDASSEEPLDRTSNGDFSVRSVFDRAQLRFAPCDGGDQLLVINTEVVVDPSERPGSSVALESSTFFELTRRSCR